MPPPVLLSLCSPARSLVRLLLMSVQALVLAIMAPAVVQAASQSVDHQRIVAADAEAQNWLSHGRDYAEQRFSPLEQINRHNVQQLGLAWYQDLPGGRGMEATPLIIDGRMYFTGQYGMIFAFDAASGEPLWQFDPKVDPAVNFIACCDVVNRGLAAWGDRLYVGALDGRLIAVDRATGKAVWQVQTVDDVSWPYTITGAPRVIKGKVIIGNGGAEMGVRGYVSAYDADSGELVWRFYTVPGDPEQGFENDAMAMAAKTWHGEWWTMGGGGTVWDSMAYDPQLDLLYIGVGNGGPWNSDFRSAGKGDNLFVSSIVALRPDTGDYVWHYQETPGDRWDYTATQHMALAELEIDGQVRKVLMQAPKNGFFYVIDRETGKLISAQPYVKVNWAERIDPDTGRPVLNPDLDYRKAPRKVYPTMVGGHNWHPSSYSPQTGLFYIPALDEGFEFRADKDFHYQRLGGFNIGVAMFNEQVFSSALLDAALQSLYPGQIIAWDPVAQQARWRVELGLPMNAGLLSTAGHLVFQGTTDGIMKAYDADTGALLWQSPTQVSVMAPPVSYAVNGEQYIAVVTGWGGALGMVTKPRSDYQASAKNRVLVWKLGGGATLPAMTRKAAVQPLIPANDYTAEQAEQGSFLYDRHCSRCHGLPGRGHEVVPDLAFMDEQTHRNFRAIVLGGIYRDRGMVSFADIISIEEADAIHAHIIARAQEIRDEMQLPAWWVALRRWFYTLLVSFN